MPPPPKNTPKPFVTQPQGGAPPRPAVGTENIPYVHPQPSQGLDPRYFGGPNPQLTSTVGPTTATVSQGGISPLMPMGVPAMPMPGYPVAPTMQPPMAAPAGLGGTPYYTPVAALPGSPGHPSYGYVRLDAYFLSRLPAAGLTFWHRLRTVDGTTAISAAGTEYTLNLYQLPQGLSLIIFYFVQNWYDAGLDPLDPDALTAFQTNQDTYGRVGINLLVNNAPVFDANEVLYDPNGGSPVIREQSGFTALNQNLLDVGNHPTAVYVRDNATVSVRYTVAALPGHVPSAVGVELRGYVIPTKSFQELLISVRNQW